MVVYMSRTTKESNLMFLEQYSSIALAYGENGVAWTAQGVLHGHLRFA